MVDGDQFEGEERAENAEREAGRDSPRPPPPERRRPAANVRELFEDVKARASRASPRLRECLLGTMMIELTSGKKFGLDWRQADLIIVPLEGDVSAYGAPDCSIRLSEDNLLRIANGDLNPQVGMLSEKIRVTGKVSFAVYFFNLIAPRLN